MSEDLKYCGECGTANFTKNNFCNKCGKPFALIEQKQILNSKLNERVKTTPQKSTSSEPKLIPSPEARKVNNKVTSEYQVLQDKLITLCSKGGVLEVYCKENFIRFVKKSGSYTLLVDLGSFEDEDETVLRLQELGYSDSNGRLNKVFPIVESEAAIFKAIEETKIIFEHILNLSSPFNFTFQELYDVGPAIKVKAAKNKDAKISSQGTKGVREGVYGCLMIFAFIIISLMFIGYCKGPSKPSEPTTDLESNEMKQNAFFYSKYYVEERLKSPATAEFSHTDYSCSVSLDDSTYYVTSYVDAQNSFGALIRNNFVAVMKYKGGDPNDGKNWAFDSMEFIPGD